MVLLGEVWYIMVAAAASARTTLAWKLASVRRCVKEKRQALMDDKE